MEHVVCKKCTSEYDLSQPVQLKGELVAHDTVCEVCGTVLKNWADGKIIAVMTKRGSLDGVHKKA